MPSSPRYVAMRTGLLVSCRVHPMWAMPVTQIAALAMHLIRFFKMVAHFVSDGFECRFGVIVRRWRVCRSVWLLGLFLAACSLTACIQAGSFFEDSIIRPPPTYRFDPFGAGMPCTQKSMMLVKMVASFVQFSACGRI